LRLPKKKENPAMKGEDSAQEGASKGEIRGHLCQGGPCNRRGENRKVAGEKSIPAGRRIGKREAILRNRTSQKRKLLSKRLPFSFIRGSSVFPGGGVHHESAD